MARDEFVVITSLSAEIDCVIAHIEWYDEDPDEYRGIQPTLVDHVRLPVMAIGDVTAAMVDEAIAEKRESRRRARERGGGAGVRPDVQTMMGHVRTFDGARSRRRSRRGDKE